MISECSFCTFSDKTKVASEMVRVLRPGGDIGITDITVNGALPEDIQSLLSWVACVAGPGTVDSYVSLLSAAGFSDFTVEDHADSLLRMVNDVRGKLILAELAAGLGKFDLGEFGLDEARRLVRRVVELIEQGVIYYTLFVARKA